MASSGGGSGTVAASSSGGDAAVAGRGGSLGNPSGGSTEHQGGEAPVQCAADTECTANQCESCKDAPGGCPLGSCVMGYCFYPSCAIIDACAGKSCGDPCKACYSADGSCSDGFCDRWGDCKSENMSCQMDAPRPCSPTDAAGSGYVNGKTCNQVLGWGWNGSKCIPVVGCTCSGSDCRSLLQTQGDCSAVFADHCL